MFHWQNLKDCGYKRGVHGRAWWHVLGWVFHCEWHLLSKECHIGVDLGGDEDSLLFKFAIPPISLYFGVQAPYPHWLHRLPCRDCSLAIHDWNIWIHPWCRQMEWKAADPWYMRGITIYVDDLLLGKTKHAKTEKPAGRVAIELDGRTYHGTATFETHRWKRPRWFAKVRNDTWISMDVRHGLPHAGKGTCDYNCGDDALCGWGCNGHDVEKAIGHGIESVLKYRKRYGHASLQVA